MNLVICIVVALVLFVIALFVATQIAPDQKGSTAGTLRIGASCLLAILLAGLLFVYLEG